jgi:ribonuclease P protein component
MLFVMQSRVSLKRRVPSQLQPDVFGQTTDLCHETHLPSIEDASRPHPWLSRAHEDTRRPRSAQRPPRQGAQALGRLNDRPAAAAPAKAPAVRHLPGLPWVALGGDALKALLYAPAVAKTAHFVLQVASERPFRQELPTGVAPDRTESVDNSISATTVGLALIVPKRHAKRAATRNLVKRQMREVMHRRLADWAGRQVLIRQRGPFAPKQFPSAASDALRQAVRGELDQLFAQAAAR